MNKKNTNQTSVVVSAISIFFISLCASSAFAQKSDDYNKVEFYGGYSYNRAQPNTETLMIFGTRLPACSSAAAATIGANFQTLLCQRRGFNGFDTSLAYNVSRYVGIKGDVTGHYHSEQFVDTLSGQRVTQQTKNRGYNFLVGVQVKDNQKDARVKPFAHALIGAARQNFTNASSGTGNFTVKSNVTSLALKLGGGIDLRVNHRFDLRLIEVDYNPIFTRDYASSGFPLSPLSQKSKTSNNFTVGFGIVIH